jgi:allene oxide cyclase-like protein
MNGKRNLGVLIALLVLAVVSGVGADTTRTITVINKSRDVRVVDLQPAGPSQGDLRVFNGPLYNEDETEVIGHVDGVCTLTDPEDDPSEQAQVTQCLLTFSLPDGAITVQGVQLRPALTELHASRTRDAITGGTGAYQTARGERHGRVEGEKVISTFSLILKP